MLSEILSTDRSTDRFFHENNDQSIYLLPLNPYIAKELLKDKSLNLITIVTHLAVSIPFQTRPVF